MRLLLDENLPRKLKRLLPEHEVFTVQERGWAGLKNGKLIARIDSSVDALLTADKNLQYQQNLTNRKVSIVELPSNRWPIVQKYESEIRAAVQSLQGKTGQYVIIEDDQR